MSDVSQARIDEHDRPVYLRLSRAVTIPVHSQAPRLEWGKGLTLRPGQDVWRTSSRRLSGSPNGKPVRREEE
jgi:transketolase C-terminal domain/subunit